MCDCVCEYGEAWVCGSLGLDPHRWSSWGRVCLLHPRLSLLSSLSPFWCLHLSAPALHPQHSNMNNKIKRINKTNATEHPAIILPAASAGRVGNKRWSGMKNALFLTVAEFLHAVI